MAGQWKSMLGGAAVAALLTIPASAGNPSGWTSGGWRSFGVNDVKLDAVVGRLRVDVKPQAQVSIQVTGKKERVDRLAVHQVGDTLVIEGENSGAVWDWRTWFDFSTHNDDSKDLDVHVVVPKGTSMRVENMIGDATIGDTEGDLNFEATSSRATIGRTRNAHIDMAGSGRIQLADVAGELHLEIAGSGNVKAQSSKSVHAEIDGSGSAVLGPIQNGLHLEIDGTGDFNAASVNGPVHVAIAGAGSVSIPKGTADPLHVEIAGVGNFVFGGEAVDPHIDAIGVGSVKLRSYTGRLHSSGMAEVKIGPDGFPAPPTPPAPPASAAPKAPPPPPKAPH
jgi:Putative auto-transporter adhesin, head GIN domain